MTDRGRVDAGTFRSVRDCGPMLPLGVFLGLALGLASVVRAESLCYRVDFEGEGETKGSYAAGVVTLSGKDWELTEALIGTLEGDWRYGARSARLRGCDASAMTLLDGLSNGLARVVFQYRRYGTDDQRAWQVETTVDDGVAWTRIGAVFTAPDSDEVQTFDVELAVEQPVRLRIRTADTAGDSLHRLNIDEILLFPAGVAACRPWVESAPVSNLGPVAALGGGRVLYDGGAPLLERGVVFHTEPEPTTNHFVAVAEPGAAEFAVELGGLVPGRPFYARAYALNSVGVRYGAEERFVPVFTNAPAVLAVTPLGPGRWAVSCTEMAGALAYEADVATDDAFTRGDWAPVFRETCGHVEENTTLADHVAADGFDNAHVLVNDGGAEQAADVRTSRASSGYEDPCGHSASGEANVFFTSSPGDYGFAMHNIPVEPDGEYFLGYGYRNESSTSTIDFTVEWSNDDGVTWQQALCHDGRDYEEFGTTWTWVSHRQPLTAGPKSGLSVRWIKRDGSGAMRIDDILLKADDGSGSLLPGHAGQLATDTEWIVEDLPPGRYYVRVRALGENGETSPYSDPHAFDVVRFGTIMLFH